MAIPSLVEHETVQIPVGDIPADDAITISQDSRFELTWPNPLQPNHYGLRSQGWIGQFPVSDDTLIRVEPKVPIGNLFAMLEVAYNLKSFKFFDGTTDIETVDDLIDRICDILAKRVLDRVRRGLYRSYVRYVDDLSVVRGRINIRDNIRNVIRHRARLACEFDELTPDLEENQILLWTLRTASRLPIEREEVRTNVRRAYRALAGSVSLKQFRFEDCIGRLYSRLNHDYQPMHGLCRFILENTTPNISSGPGLFSPFCLSMHNLFEKFVAEWLRDNAPQSIIVRPQYRLPISMSNGALAFDVDVSLIDKFTQEHICVVDTKYKADGKISPDDLHQIVSYSVGTGSPVGFLVYPMSAGFVPNTAEVGSIRVRSMGIDLTRDLNSECARFLGAVINL